METNNLISNTIIKSGFIYAVRFGFLKQRAKPLQMSVKCRSWNSSTAGQKRPMHSTQFNLHSGNSCLSNWSVFPKVTWDV